MATAFVLALSLFALPDETDTTERDVAPAVSADPTKKGESAPPDASALSTQAAKLKKTNTQDKPEGTKQEVNEQVAKEKQTGSK